MIKLYFCKIIGCSLEEIFEKSRFVLGRLFKTLLNDLGNKFWRVRIKVVVVVIGGKIMDFRDIRELENIENCGLILGRYGWKGVVYRFWVFVLGMIGCRGELDGCLEYKKRRRLGETCCNWDVEGSWSVNVC